MKTRHLLLMFLVLSTATLFAQHVEINSQNKTIAVSADATISVDAEIAVLHVGYSNFAKTKEEAFRANNVVANEITQKLGSIGIRPDQIESAEVSLERVEAESNWSNKKSNKSNSRRTNLGK